MSIDRKSVVKLRVVAICIQDGQVLLVKHKRFTHSESFPEAYWILPGGGVEHGETMEDALKREMIEETGLECEVGRLLFIKELLYPFPGAPDQGDLHHSVSLCFLATVTGGTLQTGTDPEFPEDKQVILETNWLPIDTLETYPIYPPFLPAFVKEGYQNSFEAVLPEYFDSLK
ncbi:MAG: NUDIX domain-containing protein [Chlorobiales bacterium]|jgi:8-oxo-dGTP diphosphatase|nr:NUDIX domain-containing protein [Chlorobiales bacterium]